MEILRSNFLQSLPTIAEAINSASLLAIDAEFSGLNVKWGVENSFDTPQERYSKLKEGSKEFIIIQFGLCTFTWDKKQESYIAKPFNFYIFPKVWNRQCPDVRFLCQSSSIDFLTEHSFDFNKLFREGISYLRPYDETKLREHFLARSAQDSFTSTSFTSPDSTTVTEASGGSSQKTPRAAVPPEHKEFVEKACDSIEEMLKDPEGKVTQFPPCNGYLRKLIYQNAKQRFKAGIHMEAAMNEKKERFIVVTKVNEDEKKKMEEEKQAKEQELIENAVGFSQVVKMISQSGKLVVGHNMCLDLIHVIDQFLCPLPEHFEDFKATISAVFPRLVDTKVMANTQPFRDLIPSSVLADLVKHVSKKPFQNVAVQFDEGFSNYEESNEKAHEAGYDAYITGLAFISMSNHLGSFQEPPKINVPPDSSLVVPFLNKIFVMRMEDVPYFNLAGPDLNPSRDHVFYLTFPSDWKQGDILDLFNNFGFVYISWINSTSAFISLARRENANKVLDVLDCEGECYTIVSYAEHRRQLHGVHEDNMEYERRTPLKRPRYMDVGWKTSSPKEIQADKTETIATSEPEEGEIVDDEESPEPAKKKQKKEDKAFEEPVDW
ncbi:poly(A)-specific ribonuclease PARN-like [Oculina patagonica]